MINTDELRGIIYSRGLTQAKVAKSIGITQDSFYRKMKKRVFNSDEIYNMIDLLKIDDPIPVFFMRKN